MRIDKILTIPIPYRFLLIDSIPYRFDSLSIPIPAYRFDPLSILLSILILTSAEVGSRCELRRPITPTYKVNK